MIEEHKTKLKAIHKDVEAIRTRLKKLRLDEENHREGLDADENEDEIEQSETDTQAMDNAVSSLDEVIEYIEEVDIN